MIAKSIFAFTCDCKTHCPKRQPAAPGRQHMLPAAGSGMQQVDVENMRQQLSLATNRAQTRVWHISYTRTISISICRPLRFVHDFRLAFRRRRRRRCRRCSVAAAVNLLAVLVCSAFKNFHVSFQKCKYGHDLAAVVSLSLPPYLPPPLSLTLCSLLLTLGRPHVCCASFSAPLPLPALSARQLDS